MGEEIPEAPPSAIGSPGPGEEHQGTQEDPGGGSVAQQHLLRGGRFVQVIAKEAQAAGRPGG